MPKIGHQYIDTPMPFSEVPLGVKFMWQGCLCQRFNASLSDNDHAINAVDLDTRQRLVFGDNTEVIAWMPKSLLAQREREKTPEWQRKWREAQERAKNGWSDLPDESEFFPDGWKDRELRFIPIR